MSATDSSTGRGIAVAAAALAFGVAADVLARTVPARLDVALGLGVLVLSVATLVWLGRVPGRSGLVPLVPPLALLALALLWRDSATLFTLNLLGIALLAVLAAPRLRSTDPGRCSPGDCAVGAAQVLAGTAAGAAPLLFTEIDWRSPPDGGRLRRLRAAGLGLLASTPPALVFGSLLMDADPVFDRLMTAAVAPGLDGLVEHGVVILLWGWLAAGLLRLLLLQEPDGAERRTGIGGRFGLIEVGTVLAVLNLLFLVFVVVQFRYLFGGGELVRTVAGLSYAEYARQGFFQLVTVAALSLPLLLAADAALGRRDRPSLRRFRLLATVMLLLLNVMLASALWRMRLYTAEYGLTELRLYTTAFMGWLVLVFGWLAATVLRGRRDRFAFGAVTAAFLVLGALNLLNPDGLIAGSNLARHGRGRDLDTEYLRRLSADALPAIHHGLWRLPGPERCSVAAVLADRWTPELAAGARWNIAVSRAAEVVRQAHGDCLTRRGG